MIELSIPLIQRFVVRVLDRGSENGIGENEEHDDRGEARRLNELRADRRSETFLLVLIDVHEFQRAIVGFLQNLERMGRVNSPSARLLVYFGGLNIGLSFARTPHLLELNTDFSERFDDDGNEDVLGKWRGTFSRGK